MIAVIRISGQVNLASNVNEALFRLRIRRKYICTLIQPTPENLKLLQFLRNFIAFGDINEETLKMLISKRGVMKDKNSKVDAEKIIKEIEKKGISESSIKPFFRMHPPRGGIDAKKHFGTSKKAVLGDNKSAINDLIRRML